MDFEREFRVPESEATVVDRLRSYMEQVGFKQQLDGSLTFRRGSPFKLLYSSSPKAGPAEATIRTLAEGSQTKVEAVVKVRVGDMMWTPADKAYFVTELAGLEDAARDMAANTESLDTIVREARKQTWDPRIWFSKERRGLLLLAAVGGGIAGVAVTAGDADIDVGGVLTRVAILLTIFAAAVVMNRHR